MELPHRKQSNRDTLCCSPPYPFLADGANFRFGLWRSRGSVHSNCDSLAILGPDATLVWRSKRMLDAFFSKL